jgi:hypothetical protein
MHLRLTLVALVITALTLPTSALPAQARLTGLERVAPSTGTDSAPKSLTATCPAGKRVVGPGGDTTWATGKTLLDRIRPTKDLTKVKLHAAEDVATSANWYAQAFVVCAPAPKGLTRVKRTSTLTSKSPKRVVATCPTGKKLLGAGFEITGASGHVLITGLAPGTSRDRVAASATEDEFGTPTRWTLTAYATCAPRPKGYEVVSAASASDSATSKVATASCPNGKWVTGVLGTINGARGQVLLDSLFQDVDLASASITAAEDATGTGAGWGLRSYAVCVSTA